MPPTLFLVIQSIITEITLIDDKEILSLKSTIYELNRVCVNHEFQITSILTMANNIIESKWEIIIVTADEIMRQDERSDTCTISTEQGLDLIMKLY